MKNSPVLILHGWNLSAANMEPLRKEFYRRGYKKVLCPDLPGFGSAPLPKKELSLSDYVSFIKHYLKINSLQKVILIGHSFGGRIGINLGVENPELIRLLVLSGTPAIKPVSWAKIGKKILLLPLFSYFRYKAKIILYKMAQASDFYNTDEKMRQTFKNIVRENLQSILSQIAIPTLLVWGENDQIVPLNIAYRMSRVIRDSHLVIIPNARHGVPYTHPKEFVAEVEKFLNQLWN